MHMDRVKDIDPGELVALHGPIWQLYGYNCGAPAVLLI